MWAVHLEWILTGASGCHGSRSFRESCLDHCAPAESLWRHKKLRWALGVVWLPLHGPDLWKWNIPIALFFHFNHQKKPWKTTPTGRTKNRWTKHQSLEFSSGGSASSYGDGWNGWRGDKLRGEGRSEDGTSRKKPQKQLRFGKILSRSKIWTSLGGVFRYQRCKFLILSENVRFCWSKTTVLWCLSAIGSWWTSSTFSTGGGTTGTFLRIFSDAEGRNKGHDA